MRSISGNRFGSHLHLQTYEKDAWTSFELMELQVVLADNQLLIVEVKRSDYSCHFLFSHCHLKMSINFRYADFNTDSADACILVMACVDCARACS